jgi:hypothetical protein
LSMPQISKKQAIRRARSRLILDSLIPAQVLRVDSQTGAYFLVIFGKARAAVGIAAVDIITGEIMIHAGLPGTESFILLDKEKAIRCAGFSAGAKAELIWKSCKVSRSPLYPFWKISHKTKTVYVNQQGMVFRSLDKTGLG